MPNSSFNKLTARSVATLRAPGRHTDGLGLHLYIDPSGRRRWVLRMTIQGRRRDIGLGSAVEVSLAEARERRDQMRRQLRDGVNPLNERNRVRSIPTFETYANRMFESIRADWKNPKHAQQWINTLKTYAFPVIGKLPINQVNAQVVKQVLAPIWTEKPETARRVKQRIGRIISAAIGEQLHPGPNPTPNSTTALAARRPKVKNFAAMPYREVPAFIRKLAATSATPGAKRAFQLLILTATRTNEVLNARWREIDIENREWTIPAERMKMGSAHIVPLSTPAVALLRAARTETLVQAEDLVFPGAKSGRHLSNMVFLQIIKRLGHRYTAHGFRSAFRDWAEEQTSFAYSAKEAALAHKTRDKVEAAYRRTTMLEQRRDLMEAWAQHCVEDASS